MKLPSRRPPLLPQSAFAVFRFPPEIIVVAIRWYLRYNLSYRDVEELLLGNVVSRCSVVVLGQLHVVDADTGVVAESFG